MNEHVNDGFLQLKLLKYNKINTNYCCLYIHRCMNTLGYDILKARANERYNTRNNNPFNCTIHEISAVTNEYLVSLAFIMEQ